MRMTENQFVGFLVTHVGNVKVALFASYDAIEDHMLEHVTQFLDNFFPVVVYQGITQLVRLFYRMWSETLVGLFPVPRTFLPEIVENV